MSKTTVEEAGGCNGCTERTTMHVYRISAGLEMRLCRSCMELLVESFQAQKNWTMPRPAKKKSVKKKPAKKGPVKYNLYQPKLIKSEWGPWGGDGYRD